MGVNRDRVARALALVEERLGEALGLDDLAAAAGLSPFHFHRLFTALVGRPPSDYVRRRRLTEAARALVGTSRPIVQIAFDCAFASQEAFTRAFERQHGTSPGAFRRRALPPTVVQDPVSVHPLEPRMENLTREPRLVEIPPFHVVGSARTYVSGEPNDIPDLWQGFWRRHGEVRHVVPDRCYGVCCALPAAGSGEAPRFEYVAGVGVERIEALPDGMVARTVPGGRYLVFTHRGPIAGIKETINFIWGTWLPRSTWKPAATPDFELYDERYDGERGEGEVDIYVPVGPPG